MSAPPVRAVLFDVGGPLDREELYEQLIDEHIREELARAGIQPSPEECAAAAAWAVDVFAPNAYAAVIWRLTRGDAAVAARAYAAVAARAGDRHDARGGFELRAGVADLLADLSARGIALGLAANQPADAIARMEAAGIARFFSHQGVSGTHGFRKPDPRVFLHACDALGVRPEACVMVGDRIDNDIAPARGLGMRTVLFRTGRHAAQQPRTWEEVPDAEARTVPEMRAALLSLIAPAR